MSDKKRIFMIAALSVCSLSLIAISLFYSPFLDFGSSTQMDTTIRSLRLYRTVAVSTCGALLAICGALCQQVFRNNLASPSVLGFESLASLLLVCGIALGSNIFEHDMARLCGSIVGAIIGATLCLSLAKVFRTGTFVWLLLAGVGINAFSNAGSALVMSLISDDIGKLAQISAVTLGSMQGKGEMQMYLGAAAVPLLLLFVRKFSYRIDMISQGESFAQNFGLNVKSVSTILMLVLGCSVGVAVMVGSPMPFLGLVAPICARRFVGSKTNKLALLSGVFGFLIALAADLVARWLLYPRELETGVVIALVGAPFFVAVLIQQARKS